MPRKARVEFPGAVYHLLDRGDRQEAIFRDDTDREQFLATLGQACARTGWRVHAFVLMNRLTMRWSERRPDVRSIFEMTSTLPLRATRALVRRRSSWSR